MTTVPQHEQIALRCALLDFFDAHARTLPWRENADPYRVWVSEVMLQQTRVDTVVPYYNRWMTRFPNLTALAEAPLDSVLEAWAGLGYYSRARNLHQAAWVVRESHGGKLPTNMAELRALPGVGEYTAGAVASIAFQHPAPAVDGNVRRVLSRLFDLEKPTAALLRTYATELVDPERPGDFNQALMELGATVCTPRSPDCTRCPVAGHCLALARGTVHLRPLTRPKKAIPVELHAVAVPRLWIDGDPIALLRRRPESGLLGGMLEFPGEVVSGPPEDLTKRAKTLMNAAQRALFTMVGPDPMPGVELETGVELEPVRHRFSHLKVTYQPYLFDLYYDGIDDAFLDGSDALQVAWPDLVRSALPAAQRRIARLVERRLMDAKMG